MEINNLLKEGKRLNYRLLDNYRYKEAAFEQQLNLFWAENPVLHQLVQQHADLEAIRKWIYNYLADYERKTLYNHFYSNMLERNIARKCIQVLKNVFSKRSEDLTGYSILSDFMKMAHHQKRDVSLGFIEELRHLFLGMKGNTGLEGQIVSMEHFNHSDPRAAARSRSDILNSATSGIKKRLVNYRCGLDEEVILQRLSNRKRIMAFFGATDKQWNSWSWQCRHIIRDARTLSQVVDLSPSELKAVEKVTLNRLPFGVTPYYLTLMDFNSAGRWDRAVRAQVIPPLDYVDNILKSREQGLDLDFMGEKDTSPVELVTRRYPLIAIFKPHNTCAQICVYCQRNWEIQDVMAEEAKAHQSTINKALDWFEKNTALEEILITGGDPGIISNALTKKILGRLAKMNHIRRIRIGTRVPVVLPMRITDEYADILGSFVKPGKREVVLMTHFEHPYEVTPESMEAVQRLRARRVTVYNQTVFTVENARRFEMASLRIALRRIGVDPYYTFNAKGKEETRAYRAPIARLVQEQAEESRLTPGLDRTDEAVFNIPRLGKNYLRAGQDHEVIMIMPNGARIYEFYPWDQNIFDTGPYLHEDVPIMDFLLEMARRDEDPEDYKSIWYYF